MGLSSLTAKSIRNLLKRGCGLQEFCNRYECTEEALQRKVRALYSRDLHTADELVSQMKDNDKKPKRKPKDTNCSEAEAEKVVDEGADAEVEAEAEQACQTEVKMTWEEKVAKIRDEEAALSAKVMGVESHHKRLAETHRGHIMRLRTLSDEIKDLKATFKAKCAEYEKIVEDCNNVGTEMNQASEERRALVAELEAVRQRIEGLQIINVGVYSDGKIEAFDYPELTFDDSGFESNRDRLLSLPECQELTVNDVKILARLLRIIENSSAKIKVIFDNDNIELAFMLITESETA